jgi:hypothetical protein
VGVGAISATSVFIFVVHCISLFVVAGVGVYLCVFDRYLRPRLHVAMLVAGIIGGMTLVVSGLYVMEYWSELMEHVDFTEIVRVEVNPKRLPSRFYFLPATSISLGAAATIVFARMLFGHWRELKRS